jgi:hypothetical protein
LAASRGLRRRGVADADRRLLPSPHVDRQPSSQFAVDKDVERARLRSRHGRALAHLHESARVSLDASPISQLKPRGSVSHREHALDLVAHYAMPSMVRFGELTYREIRQQVDRGPWRWCRPAAPSSRVPTYRSRSTPGWSRQLLVRLRKRLFARMASAYSCCRRSLSVRPLSIEASGAATSTYPATYTRPLWDTIQPLSMNSRVYVSS